jgi:hypothetical protein
MAAMKKNHIVDGIFSRMDEGDMKDETGITRARRVPEKNASSEDVAHFAGPRAHVDDEDFGRIADAEPPAAGAVADFEHVAQSVRLASMVLKDLVRKNAQISKTSAEKIDDLDRRLAAEQELRADLQRQLDEAIDDKRRIANESVRRIRELETLASELGEKLAKCTRELEISRQWLDHLRSEVDRELNNTLIEVEKALES